MPKIFSVIFLVLFSFSTFAQLASLRDYGQANVYGTSNISASDMVPVVFLDQAPNAVNGLFADASCALCGTGQQSIADNVNITIAGPNVGVTQLVIWGGYYPENIPNTTDNFTIIVHSNSGGSPGAVLFNVSGLQATSRVSTGVVLFGVNEYMFTFDFSATPIPIVTTGTYWVEIFNNSTQSGNFFWETGNLDGTHGIVGSAWTTATPGVTWNLDGATDLSVKISGDDGVPVEFTAFTANADFGVVDLQWITATETNNQGFEVQRSNGSNFETIAFIQGAGTTTESQVYTYSDKSVQVGSYTYRLKQINFDGTSSYSNEVEINVPAPAEFALEQNFPNPFNPSTQIAFRLAVDSKVTLKVFNILGQEITTLINTNLIAGGHSINFDASALNSGVYLYRIEASGIDGSNFVDIKKMILTK